MARQARRCGITGIYHIVIRGINKEDIFLDEQDYRFFLSRLKKYRTISKFDVLTYCLMSNHVHLLIDTNGQAPGHVMSRILIAYSTYFNSKYERTGHLFQNRFISEPVDSESYFFHALRYIVYNPVKAGMCADPSNYTWSSFNAYLGHDDNLTASEKITALFPDFKEMIASSSIHSPDEIVVPEYLPKVKYTDAEVRDIAKKISGCRTPAEFRDLSRTRRDECIRALREKKIPIRQIRRVTGFPFTAISNIK